MKKIFLKSKKEVSIIIFNVKENDIFAPRYR